MKLRFSRSSLNLIIFTCIILIGWASINKSSVVDDLNAAPNNAVKNIELANLDALNQQSWTSQEGINIIWQSRLDTDFLIRVRGFRPDKTLSIDSEHLNRSHISWQPSYWQWDLNIGADFELGLTKLSQQIIDFPKHLKGQPATIILQGPWSANIARLTSARLIKSWQLKPLKTITTAITATSTSCPWQPVSAQFWLQDQLSNDLLSHADIKNKRWVIADWPQLAPIDPLSLQAWKHTFVQQWQLNWQTPATQFDMLADLAYYRLPENYLLQGYWGINALDIHQLEKYLAQCQASHRSI
jgi:hypothetical protein